MERTSRLRSKQLLGKDDDDLVEVGFVEPVLSNSNIVTGQRLEDPPTVKIKKELGTFKRGATKSEDLSIEELNEYKKSLKSSKEIEKSTNISNIRSSLKRINHTDIITNDNKRLKKNQNNKIRQQSNKNSKLKSFLSVPKELKLDQFFNQDLQSNSSSNSNSNKNSLSATATPDVDSTALNNDYCSCCGMAGMFLCCESCPKSYHFQCINPPIDSNNLPDYWYCKECIKKKTNGEKPNNLMVNVGIFSKLFDNIIFQDPISFQLPKEIIESFQGISTDKLGDYNDESFKPTKSYKQLIKEYDDPLNGIYDKNNNPYFCYYCGESGINKEIINCDYCSLSWHLDCLDPPLASVKKLGSKWKCPNHVDDLSTEIRKFKNQKVISISNIKNFEKSGKLPISSNIQIVNIEDKLKYLKKEIKLLHNENNLNLKYSNLTFQLNEEDIILNFINSTKIKKINENDKNFQILMNLKPNLKDYVISLSELSKKSLFDNEFKLLNLQNLLKITNDELKVMDKSFTEDEIKEFLLIKKLIQQKGKDKLLEFLKS